MTPSADSNVKNFLNSIELPGIARTIGDVGRVLDVNESEDRIIARIELGFPAQTAYSDYADAISAALAANGEQRPLDVEFRRKSSLTAYSTISSRWSRFVTSLPWPPVKVALASRQSL